MTRLAVVHATARDLDRLNEALIRVESSGDDQEYFSRADGGSGVTGCRRMAIAGKGRPDKDGGGHPPRRPP